MTDSMAEIRTTAIEARQETRRAKKEAEEMRKVNAQQAKQEKLDRKLVEQIQKEENRKREQ